MNIEDAAREKLSEAKGKLIRLEDTLPAWPTAMKSHDAWRLFCALKDVEDAEAELVQVYS